MTTARDMADWCCQRGWALWSEAGRWTIASGLRFTYRGRSTVDPQVFVRGRPGVALLWALAVEIDESGETPTGERVCRACGGRGEAWVLRYGHTWGTRHHGWTGGYPARWVEATTGSTFAEPFGQDAYETLRGVVYAAGSPWPIGAEVTIERAEVGPPELRRFAVVTSGPCACPGATTSARTMLAPVVAQLASQRSPTVTDWPAQWLVDLDAMAANGWRGSMTPGPSEPVLDWQCAWWRAFWEWAHAGAEPDPSVLGPLLAERVEARRERSLAEWRAAAEAQTYHLAEVRFARVGGEARGDGRDCPACSGRGFAESLAQVCGECLGRGRTPDGALVERLAECWRKVVDYVPVTDDVVDAVTNALASHGLDPETEENARWRDAIASSLASAMADWSSPPTVGVEIDGVLYAAARVDIDWGEPWEPVDYRFMHEPRVEIRVVVEGHEDARALVQQTRSIIAGRGASRIRVLAGGGVTVTATAWATDVRTEYHGDTRAGVSLTGVATFIARRHDVRVAEVPGARSAVP